MTKDVLILVFMFLLWGYSLVLTYRYKVFMSEIQMFWSQSLVQAALLGRRGIRKQHVEVRGIIKFPLPKP